MLQSSEFPMNRVSSRAGRSRHTISGDCPGGRSRGRRAGFWETRREEKRASRGPGVGLSRAHKQSLAGCGQTAQGSGRAVQLDEVMKFRISYLSKLQSAAQIKEMVRTK